MGPYGPAALRLCVGAVFVAHGAQKLFGVWGGPGLDGTTAYFSSMGLNPAYPLAAIVALTEFAGGLLLLIGWLARWVAMALVINMAVALYKVHYPHGFFLNWNLTPGQGHGMEYGIVLIGALVCLTLTGAGALSLDEWRDQSAEAASRARARARKV
jgi:putative oxidoreductase